MLNGLFTPPYGTIFANHNNYDIIKNEDGVTVEVSLPGLSSDDVEVTVEGDVLAIDAKSTSERRKLSFHKEFNIEGFDKKTIKPSMRNGILTIDLSLSKSSKPKKIKVLTA